MFLIERTLAIADCKEGELIAQCKCTGYVYVNATKSAKSLACGLKAVNMTDVIQSNQTTPVPYDEISSPCPINHVETGFAFLAHLSNFDQSFYCEKKDCSEMYKFFGPLRHTKCRIDSCTAFQWVEGNYSQQNGALYMDKKICQPCPGPICNNGLVQECYAPAIPVEDLYCVSCKVFNSSTCNVSGVINCLPGYYFVNIQSCLPCNWNQICLENKKFECSDRQGVICENNTVMSCQVGLTPAPDKTECITCPVRAICDVQQIIVCRVDQYLEGQQCLSCGQENHTNICNGKKKFTCAQGGGSICQNAKIISCTPEKPVLSPDALSCTTCPLGKKWSGGECKSCESMLCLGDEQELSCTANNIQGCTSGLITQCNVGFLPNKLKTKCLPLIELGIKTHDGSKITLCLSQFLLSADQLSCDSCPTNQLCNGSSQAFDCNTQNAQNYQICFADKVISCMPQFIQKGTNCLPCSAQPGAAYCDGVKITSCNPGFVLQNGDCQQCSSQNAVLCENGKILQCRPGFVPSRSKSQCINCSTITDRNLQLQCTDGINSLVIAYGNLGFGFFVSDSQFRMFECGSDQVISQTSKQCNGTHINKCKQGYYVDETGHKCVSCSGNMFCDGGQPIDCSISNAVFAKQCLNGFVTQCEPGFVVSRAFTECLKCGSESAGFVLECDGTQSFKCKDTNNQYKGIPYINFLAMPAVPLCIPCPTDGVCDGTKLVSCSNNKINTGLNCSEKIVKQCLQGQSLSQCTCQGSKVYYSGDDVSRLVCDVNSEINLCLPTDQVAESEEVAQSQNCSCSTSATVIAAYFNGKFYCVRVKSDKQYILNFGELSATIDKGQLIQTNNKGYLYSSSIVLMCALKNYINSQQRCQSWDNDFAYTITDCSQGFTLVNQSTPTDMHAVFCMPQILPSDERALGYIEIPPVNPYGEPTFRICDVNILKNFKYCNQPHDMGKSVYAIQCADQNIFKGGLCLAAIQGQLFDGYNITRCLFGSYIDIYNSVCSEPQIINFANGLKITECSSENKDEFAYICNGISIVQCVSGFFLIENLSCSPCPSPQLLFTPMCNGFVLKCYTKEKERKFVYQRDYHCIPCPPGATCDGYIIMKCSSEQLSAQDLCVPCPANRFCNGGQIAIDCQQPSVYELGIKTCEGKQRESRVLKITSCMPTYALSNDSFFCNYCAEPMQCDNNLVTYCGSGKYIRDNNCQICPAGYSCDGVQITQCLYGFYINNGQCQYCQDSNSFCNGVNKTLCSGSNSLNALSCAAYYIISCKTGYIPSDDKLYCIQCSAQFSASQCNGTHVTQCSSGYKINGNSCLKCNINGVTCSESSITQCPPNYYLLRGTCFPCLSSSQTLTAICDGLTMSCRIQGLAGYAKSFNGRLQCYSCPQNMICDSRVITKCLLQQYLDNVNIQCVDCPIDTLCDGTTNRINCLSNDVNIIACENGNVTKCKEGYYIFANKTCKLCQANGTGGFNRQCDGTAYITCIEFPSNIKGTSYIDYDNEPKCKGCSQSGGQECDGKKVSLCEPQKYLSEDFFTPGLFSCQNCYYERFCDGKTMQLCNNCDTDNKIAESCINGAIQKCCLGNIIQKDFMQCLPCPVVSGFFVTDCDPAKTTFTCLKEINGVNETQLSGQRLNPDKTYTPYCASCPPQAVCDSEKITRCKFGFYISESGTECVECGSGRVYCDGIKKYTCPSIDVLADDCKDGAITKCQSGYILDVRDGVNYCLSCPANNNQFEAQCNGTAVFLCRQKQNNLNVLALSSLQYNFAQCRPCPPGVICDGAKITKCPVGQKIYMELCVPCDQNSVCVGDATQTPCANVPNAVSCADGKVNECKETYHVIQGVTCSQTPGCEAGQYHDGTDCVECGDDFICDGVTRENCSNTSNSLKAFSCSGNKITQCHIFFLLENERCRPCPTGSSFMPFCDGTAELNCSSNPIYNQNVYQSDAFEGKQCLPCPAGATCDGKRITRCRFGMSLLVESCSQCGSEVFCDGSDMRQACQLVNGKTCENGLLTKCLPGYFLENSTSCSQCALGLLCYGDQRKDVCEAGKSYVEICGAGKIQRCKAGFQLIDELQCQQCYSDLCDGSIAITSCGAGNNLNILSCRMGVILQCKVGYLNKQTICEDCATQLPEISSNFCDGLGSAPVSCSSAEYAVCTGGLIRRCKAGYTVKPDGSGCIICPQGDPTILCNGETKLDCQTIAFVVRCENAKISLCELGKKIDQNGALCTECGAASYCDGVKEITCQTQAGTNHPLACKNGRIINCQPSYWLQENENKTSQSCTACMAQYICNGVNQLTCDQANGLNCTNGKIVSCINSSEKGQFYKENEFQCQACTKPDDILHCGEYPVCTDLLWRDNYLCKGCPEGHLCDGENLTDCRVVNNQIQAVTCENSRIIQCKNDYLIVDQGMKCSQCPLIENLSAVQPYCNGIIILQCYTGSVQQKLVIEIVTVDQNGAENKTCLPCPDKAELCDGTDVLRCEAGYKISDQYKECLKCSGNKVCNGVEEIDCDTVEGATGCSNGKITACGSGFEVSTDGTTCDVSKAGPCGLGCVLGIAIAIVIVLGVAIGVYLVIYFKKQRAKIDELMFRNVESVRAGRAVDNNTAKGGAYSAAVGNLKNGSGVSMRGNRESGTLGNRGSGSREIGRNGSGGKKDMHIQRMAI